MIPLAATASEEDCIQLAYYRPHRAAGREQRTSGRSSTTSTPPGLQRGLPPLVQDELLTQFALQIAEQMAERHYFGHTDPNGVTFQDRLRAAGCATASPPRTWRSTRTRRTRTWPSSIAPATTQNIVDAHPRRLGVAVVAAGDGEVFYVEEFAD